MRPDTASAIRARLIAAMTQRAASLDGEAHRVLAARLSELRALDAGAPDQATDAGTTAPPPSPLHDLVEHLAREVPPGRATYPEMPALADARRLWAELRADSQLQTSVARAPADAGPLNSTALASRAIALMHDLSPAYLRSFLAYVDDLAWIERLGRVDGGAASGAAAPKKRARGKPRA